MTVRTEKIILAVLVAVFVLLAGLYNSATPAFVGDQHNPDENAHVLYVQSLASGHVPVFHADAPDYEAHQPPLYYALCIPVYALTHRAGAAAAVHALRWVSTLLGALLIVTVWAVVRAAFCPPTPQKITIDGGAGLPLACAGFVALLPMNVSLCASVSNDALANLVCALALLCLANLARAAKQGRAVNRHALLLGLTLGTGLWTKTSTLVLWPAVLLACYLLSRYKLIPAQDAMRAGAVSLGTGLVIGLPWLIRNQILYGDPVAQHVFQNAFTGTAHAADFVRVLGWPVYLVVVAQWTFASFWGVFDSMRCFWGQGPHTPSPLSPLPPVYGVFGIVTVAALVGLRGYLKTQALTAVQRVLWWTFAALVFCTFLAHLRFILTFFQAQGRYDYPALVPLAFFFAAGWAGLLNGRALPRVLVVMGLGLFALNLYTTLFLLPARFGGQ